MDTPAAITLGILIGLVVGLLIGWLQRVVALNNYKRLLVEVGERHGAITFINNSFRIIPYAEYERLKNPPKPSVTFTSTDSKAVFIPTITIDPPKPRGTIHILKQRRGWAWAARRAGNNQFVAGNQQGLVSKARAIEAAKEFGPTGFEIKVKDKKAEGD